jgi:hypothetical protein
VDIEAFTRQRDNARHILFGQSHPQHRLAMQLEQPPAHRLTCDGSKPPIPLRIVKLRQAPRQGCIERIGVICRQEPSFHMENHIAEHISPPFPELEAVSSIPVSPPSSSFPWLDAQLHIRTSTPFR